MNIYIQYTQNTHNTRTMTCNLYTLAEVQVYSTPADPVNPDINDRFLSDSATYSFFKQRITLQSGKKNYRQMITYAPVIQ